jgi:hypothetical protein
MRWLVAIVTAWCLLGAGSSRVEVRGEHGRQAQLVGVPHGAAVVAARRDGGRGDLRLGAFVSPGVVAAVEPPPARVVERVERIADVAYVAAPEPVSRGPPRG